jgi:signal transduction histidine kinase
MRNAEQQLTAWITAYAQSMQRNAIRSAMITGGAALAALALVLLATVIVARSMVRRLGRLETAASASDEVNQEAARRAWEQAQLYAGASATSASFFQRSHSLLERLVRLIDTMELTEDDPERLASLFEMDHLATRIWRNSDSALALAGYETPRHSTDALSLMDVVRGAVSEIEQYDRVAVNVQQGVQVSGTAATDAVHLVAELLENAAMFSPTTAEVAVSGHLVRGGGAFISITDGGTGMPEEQLRQLNWQLANPSAADVAVAGHMGLFAVAHLAVRHGIRVRLSTPPDGGTTAEVLLPAALISLDARTGGRPGPAGEALRIRAGEDRTGADEEADAWLEAAESPLSVLGFGARPEPSPEPETGTLGPETGTPEAVPMLLGAPLPSPAPETSPGLAAPGLVSAEPDGVLPIFESVESSHGRGPVRHGDPQTAQSAPAEPPAGPPAAWGAGGGRLVSESPAAGSPASSGLPQRTPQRSRVRGAAVDQGTGPDTPAETAETTRSQLASFQQGSRRARAAARSGGSRNQPDQDG